MASKGIAAIILGVIGLAAMGILWAILKGLGLMGMRAEVKKLPGGKLKVEILHEPKNRRG